ncbi:MAG: alpha-amylase family glycosyl hydrolase [Nostoc sp.]
MDIDPHFGTRQDLRDLIDAAHDRRMYVILYVIYNQSADNWFYRDDLIAALARVYQYWIAVCDCDGFCIESLKQVSLEDSRKFCTAISEYTQSIGKDNFLLAGEMTCRSMAGADIDIIGRNLSAVLDNVQAPNELTALAKGLVDPKQFFDLYSNNLAGEYRQIGIYHVCVLDDEWMSFPNNKQRFAAYSNVPNLYEQVAHAVGVQLFLYKSDWSNADLRNPRQNQTVAVQHHNDGRATVRIDLPASGMVILA